MTDQEILNKIEERIKKSENWNIYHHLTDNLGHPALMLEENCSRSDHQGVSIDVFNDRAYVFLDNGTPAEPGRPFSVQKSRDIVALVDLLDIVRPYVKEG